MKDFVPLVTIICLTFNHEKYIQDALESFVKQKTTFSFEVIIHDDASVDKTANIIREYEKRYPDLIKPIYQKKNQYSKNKDIIINFILPKAQGKYVAFCEGDDYWIDEKKLQMQFEYMETHTDCSLVAHKTIEYNPSKNIFYDFTPYDYSKPESCNLTPKKVIADHMYFHTSSMFFRKDHFYTNWAFYENIEVCFDYVIKIMLATEGTVHVIPEIMSVYRKGIDGSWTNRVENNKDRHIEHIKIKIKNLEAINEYRKLEYDLEISNVIQRLNLKQHIYLSDKNIIKNLGFYSYVKKLRSKEKIKLYLQLYFPRIYDRVSKCIQILRVRRHRCPPPTK